MSRKIRVAAAAAIILFVIMAAVGYSSEKETGDVLSTSGVESSNENVFKVNLTTNPITVDPAKAVSESELLLVRALYDTLVDYQGGEVKPAIAENWVFSEDGKELYIQLRRDAKFSNGKPVTASDVEFSLERVLDPNTASPYAPLLAAYLGGTAVSTAVEPIDETSLAIRFSKPRWDFLELLGHPAFSIVSIEGVIDSNFGHAGTFMEPGPPVIGSGPLKIVEWVNKRNVALEPNQHYYSVVPKVDRVELVVNDSMATTIYDFGAEYLDAAYLRTADINKMILENPLLKDRLFTGSLVDTYFLSINPQTQFFKDIETRQAVIAAIDVTQLIESSEIFTVSQSPLKGLSRSDGIYTGEPKKVLENMGYGQDKKVLELIFSYPSGEVAAFIARNIKDQLESSLGISVQLKEVPFQGAAMVDESAHLSLVQWTVPYSGNGAFFPYFLGQGVNPFIYGNSLGEAGLGYFNQIGTLKEQSQRDQYYTLISNEISQQMVLYPLVDVKNLYALQEGRYVPGSLKTILGITNEKEVP